METVVNQHGIDMEALRRVPFAGGPQAGDSSGASMSKDKEVIGNQSPMIGSDASLNSGQAGLWQFPSGKQFQRKKNPVVSEIQTHILMHLYVVRFDRYDKAWGIYFGQGTCRAK